MPFSLIIQFGESFVDQWRFEFYECHGRVAWRELISTCILMHVPMHILTYALRKPGTLIIAYMLQYTRTGKSIISIDVLKVF